MEAIQPAEAVVSYRNTTQRYNPQDFDLKAAYQLLTTGGHTGVRFQAGVEWPFDFRMKKILG
jgi:hypothetical protein